MAVMDAEPDFYEPWILTSWWNMIQQPIFEWEFQDPKMDVPTIYKAYIRPM